jgi:hypothetical protein
MVPGTRTDDSALCEIAEAAGVQVETVDLALKAAKPMSFRRAMKLFQSDEIRVPSWALGLLTEQDARRYAWA